jgi:hypothetical protein
VFLVHDISAWNVQIINEWILHNFSFLNCEMLSLWYSYCAFDNNDIEGEGKKMKGERKREKKIRNEQEIKK